jgi:aminoglycoside/choline kinase family phosphotransferase
MNAATRNFARHFLESRGLTPDESRTEKLQGDGSKRLFWRLFSVEPHASFIFLVNPPMNAETQRENSASVNIGMHLKTKGVPVPEIYAFDLQNGWIIMEDLGRMRLQDVVAAGEDPLPLYREILPMLLHLQLKGAEGFDHRWCCQTRYYDHAVMRGYESDYFREAFLHRYLGLQKQWPELEPAFEYVAQRLARSSRFFFLYRDFQSRNILLHQGSIGFVDWQGGRLGPLGYDLASLLIDPYVALSPENQHTLFQEYRDLLKNHDSGLARELTEHYPFLALQRNLQILGAFATLTQVHGKTYFEEYIPSAVRNLRYRLTQMDHPNLASLKRVMHDVTRHFRLDKPLSTG